MLLCFYFYLHIMLSCSTHKFHLRIYYVQYYVYVKDKNFALLKLVYFIRVHNMCKYDDRSISY